MRISDWSSDVCSSDLTVVLFFEKGAPTRDIWFYQLDPGRSLGKTNPLNDGDLAEFVELQKTFAEGPKSWRISRVDLDEETLDLSAKNPNAPEAAPLRSPEERSEEHTSELQSLMRLSYAVFCLKKQKTNDDEE